MKKESITAVISENQHLNQKLANLEKRKQDMGKAELFKRPVCALTHSKFLPTNKQYENVASKTDYDFVKHQMTIKNEKIQRAKERVVEEFSFRPTINEKTTEFINIEAYVAPHSRPLPVKKVEATQKLSEEERIQTQSLERTIKMPKKIDEEYYKKLVDWKNKQEEKALKERLVQGWHEGSSNSQPQTNKKVNEQLFKKEANFIDRVQADMERSKNLKAQLDNKYNDFSFKPRTNKNIAATSVVYEKILSKTGQYSSEARA
jgi:hypothetical protein